MTVITNDVMQGPVDGLSKGVPISGTHGIAGINVGFGDPSDKITAQTGSDIFYDATNSDFYMALGAAGSTWVRLISGT